MHALYNQFIDLVENKAHIYKDDLGQDIEITDVPADMKEEVDQWRNVLMETIAENDEDLIEKFLESGELSNSDYDIGIENLHNLNKVLVASPQKPLRSVSVNLVWSYVASPFPIQ